MQVDPSTRETLERHICTPLPPIRYGGKVWVFPVSRYPGAVFLIAAGPGPPGKTPPVRTDPRPTRRNPLLADRGPDQGSGSGQTEASKDVRRLQRGPDRWGSVINPFPWPPRPYNAPMTSASGTMATHPPRDNPCGAPSRRAGGHSRRLSIANQPDADPIPGRERPPAYGEAPYSRLRAVIRCRCHDATRGALHAPEPPRCSFTGISRRSPARSCQHAPATGVILGFWGRVLTRL